MTSRQTCATFAWQNSTTCTRGEFVAFERAGHTPNPSRERRSLGIIVAALFVVIVVGLCSLVAERRRSTSATPRRSSAGASSSEGRWGSGRGGPSVRDAPTVSCNRAKAQVLSLTRREHAEPTHPHVDRGGSGAHLRSVRGGSDPSEPAATGPTRVDQGPRLIARPSDRKIDGVFEVEDGRSLYLRCTGEGSPTLILEGGDGDTKPRTPSPSPRSRPRRERASTIGPTSG